MAYVIDRKQGIQFSGAQGALTTLIPVVIAGFLVVAFFSSSTYSASGRQPVILRPPHHSASSSPVNPGKTSINSTGPSRQPGNNGNSSAYISAPSSLSTSSLSGGMGGGTLPYTSSSGTSPTSANPLQTTVTTPPINESVGGKQILSAPSTSITVN